MTKPNLNPSVSELRKFAIVMTIAFGLLSLIAIWKDHWSTAYVFWGIAGIGFQVPCLIAPMALLPVFKVWMRFALVLGWINARIILSILFYFIFTPVSLVQKIIKRDPLERRFPDDKETYWIDRSHEEYNPKHFERQF